MKNLKPPCSESGFSLVSLLIGMIISLITIMALFILFQLSTRQSSNMKKEMELEGQLAIVLLSIQQGVQSAGYGIFEDSDKQIKVITGDYNSIYWRYEIDKSTTTYQCQGFEEYITSDGTLKMRWLNEVNCLSDDTLDINLWPDSKKELIASFEDEDGSLLEFDWSGDTESCWPYSQGENSMHPILKVKALNSIINTSDQRQSYQFDYCLTNLK